MNYQKPKSISDCVGGGHQSNTIFIAGGVTEAGQKILLGKCSNYNRSH